ncbi:DNA-directed RNA polymerase-like protein [Leishmania mexicana MHOM/GT/2001/U1103]|uniref:DNA-directed RNA polymerase-like protein n=1 Tax=Leishmania mexicana (strain MHOM/GT/2001/U1103) TaxID=929439 RepID=E9B026_LEIMU|nr:DNA-directed RNA polymerase-like protein [Leishmania mexicana MHOM/GT/2001/U1103]CBZ28577.1 DNA-directed RNA polymerase-like protein [Leishmania mexicana MHOM/GT/2001/U1103]
MASFHPRDAFILHQEHIQRMNEGDEVDTSEEQKVQIDLQRITDNESTAVVTFSHEDHTLGNPLRHVLMQNAAVTSAGYAIPHPLEPKMLLHVQASDYAVEAVAMGLERLAEICDDTISSFDNCMVEQHRMAAAAQPE